MGDFKDFIKTVKERTEIVRVIGRYIKLDKHNKGMCPFHEDKSPSFSVDPQGRYFKCFGCGKGGDVFEFLKMHAGMSFWEALQELAQEAGLSLPDMSPADRRHQEETRIRQEILNETALYHHQQLSSDARSYLASRGFCDELIRDYRIGFGDGTLAEHLIDGKKYDVEACIRAGVLTQSGSGLRDFFAGRIVFPNSKNGRFVHMTGRILGDYQPKYLHLRGEIKYLYNEDALQQPQVVLTEGVPDCLSIIQAGHPAVAIFGTSAFKPEYETRFNRCSTVYVAMDNDEAGRKAALEIGAMLGSKARIVSFTDAKDLNEYFLRHPPDDLQGLLKEAKDIIRCRICHIPVSIDKVDLHGHLQPVLHDLAALNKPLAEAYLGRDIKERFDLTAAEVSAYRSRIAEIRDEQVVDPPAAKAESNELRKMTAQFPGLVDLVDDNGKVAFLVKENETLVARHEIVRDGETLAPPPRESIKWLLPEADKVIKHYASPAMLDGSFSPALYRELIDYHKGISDLPGEEYYSFLACWDMHTYVLEQVQYSPIICFSALPARGKTRTGKGLIYVAYRGVYEQSLREANIIRFGDNYQGTMFFDIRDFWRRVELCGSEDIFLSRFEKGGRVSRVMYPDRGPFLDTVSYRVFGSTIICTNEPIDEILETRSITLNMRDAVRQFDTDVLPENGLVLREKLLAFRAKQLDVPLPPVTEKPASSRLGDILRPIQQVLLLVNPDGNAEFLRFAAQLEADRQAAAILDPIAQIARAVVESRDKVDRGILSVKDVTDKINEGRSDRFHLSPQRIGRQLRTMGLKAGRTGNGSSAYFWDEGVIDGLKRQYGLE